MSTATTSPTATGGSPDIVSGLRPLVISGRQWRRPLIFMLTLALSGLAFYPAWLFLVIILVNSFKTDRYEFTIMLMLAFGAYGMTTIHTFPVKGLDLMLVASLILILIMRKTQLVRRLLWLCFIYFLGLAFIAWHSVESMRIQMITIRIYVTICCFIVPVAIFAGRQFRMERFFAAMMPFVLLMCAFYAIDAVILKGNILVPNTYAWGAQSTFLHPYLNPFSLELFRKYPPGMVFVALGAYPALRYYKLSVFQWIIIVAGLLSTQTFTVIIAFVLLFCISKGLGKYIYRSAALFVVLLGAACVVDSMLPMTTKEDGDVESTLRIYSSVHQFVDLTQTDDLEKLARFGSGRMAQLIPNLELINAEHRQLYGLGFIHPDYSNIPRYKIVNVFFTDISNNEIMAGLIEINPMQVYIYGGIFGLFLVYGFYLAICWVIRRCRYRGLFYYALFLILFMSLGNYAAVAETASLFTLAFSLGAVCLANRPPDRDYHDSEKYKSHVLQH